MQTKLTQHHNTTVTNNAELNDHFSHLPPAAFPGLSEDEIQQIEWAIRNASAQLTYNADRTRWLYPDVNVETSAREQNHSYKLSTKICNTQQEGCNEDYANKVFEHVNGIDVPLNDSVPTPLNENNSDRGSGQKWLDPEELLTSGLPDGMRFELNAAYDNQPIWHEENPEERWSSNTTLEGHMFHPGDVLHSVDFIGNELYYTVSGSGSGGFANINNAQGVNLFAPGVQEVADKFGMLNE